ncbi:hypothetical protein C7974DRAFT_406022 [Boeremia exigua]|uniref:uncharacterized protein n=1 Tax=Boeremia exigua TaxID=749465 RepID=UPI001E8CE9F5|nr:uncharacterized protein C7974DRAFT_406022 [Boeremia exigua]KAH6612648.1 hypothetical protein C7974DRAFT_406022 [Boeremia exigua]
MPNVGRPSKGCKHCRDRKVKCDQKRPSCSQCIRSGNDCHGYRDALSMMFKDETAVVAKKARKRYQALALQSPPQDSTAGQLPETGSSKALSILYTDVDSRNLKPVRSAISRYPTPDSLVREILPSIEDQARGFFIASHVSKPAIVPRGQYEWVLEALSHSDCEEVLRSSVNAASLAALANSTKNPVIAAKAHAAYGSALHMTNSALRVKETAVTDSTLISVIMLGLYENFVFQDKRSIQAWSKHVQGASALLNLRGKEQFKSNTARRIFHQFYGIIMLVSLESGQPIPDGMRELYDFCNPTSDYTIQGRQWTTRLVHFMHDAIDLNRHKDGDPIEMVNRATNLDRELDSIKALIPKIWQYETVRLSQPSDNAHGTFYHVYMDPWIAQMWNNLRICRMHLYRTVRTHLQRGHACNPPLFSPAETRPQIAAAEQVLRTTIAAVCASVPQLTGMIASPQSRGSFAASQAETALPDAAQVHPPGTFLDPARPTGMHHLIWPLFAVGSSDLASAETRQHAIDMLYFVALRIGTRQAVVLADSLKEKQRGESRESRSCESGSRESGSWDSGASAMFET